MALTALAGPTAIANAAPLAPPLIQTGQSDVVQVRDSRYRGRHFNRGRSFNRDTNTFRRSGRGYYRGYRGYRYRRPGYRYHDGFYFPESAFIAGAVLAAPRRGVVVRRYGNAHVSYCYNRYRSYRASDNTYQPSYGPRRQCVSP